MDVKGYNDIDYNYIVKDGTIFMGRGDNIGGHTKDNNSTSIGVCIIGNDGDATDRDFTSVRALYDWYNKRAGRTLRQLGHLDANPGQTDCPGSEIEAWIRAGMPNPGGTTMAELDYGNWPAPRGVGDRTVKLMVAELWKEVHEGEGAYGGDGFVLRQLARIEANGTALLAVIEQLTEIIKAGGGNVDTQAILAGVDERLAALVPVVADAVADEEAARLQG